MERLIVPVYLNQKIVFDLLAMLQGGISTVTSVTEASKITKSDAEKVSAGFGLSEAFSTLLKIDLSGTRDKASGNEEASTTSQERVHTPASLFFQLRNILIEKGYLTEPTGNELPKAGDFVEFEGYLKRNPIVETIDSFAEMMDMAEVFEEKTQPQKGKQNQPSENKKIKQQMMRFSDALKAGSTIDLSSKSLKSGYTAIVTVETSFLNDPLMSDLVDGQFKIIGKVIRSVSDSSDSINLLRKTALSKMPSTLMLEALGHLSALGSEQGFGIPELKLEIEGPAIQILPIAIYA
ncbi:hypothetical protein DFO61_3621 [Ectopseudomonas oleovorans]|uniref:Uncharacterized protein n=1 Tax=Ectopseudomonas oleovorans TaxID=301 RepID=A0A397MHS8_ECTOL|nr:hypothetical protein [Pseudomonas oleovorans]RIA21201.1 hypothetical protein DFO61_3621 [Pseudomonas oleovorans]